MPWSSPEKFWKRVDKSKGDDACWPWLGCAPNGYGRVTYLNERWIAPRLAWFLHYGSRPAANICHRCDNPLCCNPAHLFDGTQADNMADCAAKGRARGPSFRGESHPNSKLTESAVATIRERRASGETLSSIAADYGISITTVSRLHLRKSWI